MSDCFDHGFDAWESQEQEQLWGETRGPSYPSKSFIPNPLYYHTKIDFIDIVSESERAILFEFPEKKVQWIPRKLCRALKKSTVYVHTQFLDGINYDY